MKPTQEQLEDLWNAVTNLLLINEIDNKEDAYAFADSCGGLDRDMLTTCLLFITNKDGKVIGRI